MDKKRIYKTIENKQSIVDCDTGEIKEQISETTEMSYAEMEPQYIKVYLDCILKFNGLSSCFNPILVALCKHMQFADKDQILFVNKYIKEIVSKECKVSIKRIEQAVKQFVEAGLFKRKARGVYMVNPYIISRGRWEDVKTLRATFDFVTGSIEVESNVLDEQHEESSAQPEKTAS